MMNRSNMTRLLRSKGGRTSKENDPGRSVKKLSGSMTHGSLLTEPQVKALGARDYQEKEGLPRRASTRTKPKLKEDGLFANAKNVSKRGTSQKKMIGPDDFGQEHEDLYKKGGRTRRAAGRMFIQKAIKHPGALHKTLGIAEGKKIPLKTLHKAEHSQNSTTRKRAQLAETLRSFHHSHGGKRGR